MIKFYFQPEFHILFVNSQILNLRGARNRNIPKMDIPGQGICKAINRTSQDMQQVKDFSFCFMQYKGQEGRSRRWPGAKSYRA